MIGCLFSKRRKKKTVPRLELTLKKGIKGKGTREGGIKSVAQIKQEEVGRLKRQCLFLVHHTCQSHSGQGNDECQSRKLQPLGNKTCAGRILCFFSDSHTFPWHYVMFFFFRVSRVITEKKEICNEEYEPNGILRLRTWTVKAAFLLSPVSFCHPSRYFHWNHQSLFFHLKGMKQRVMLFDLSAKKYCWIH